MLHTLSNNPHGIFMAGDTAQVCLNSASTFGSTGSHCLYQTISAGSSFRFEDLKAFMWRLEVCVDCAYTRFFLEKFMPFSSRRKRKPSVAGSEAQFTRPSFIWQLITEVTVELLIVLAPLFSSSQSCSRIRSIRSTKRLD